VVEPEDLLAGEVPDLLPGAVELLPVEGGKVRERRERDGLTRIDTEL
jgi:hypothetical protein